MAGSLPHVERAPRSLDVSAAAQFVSQTLTTVTSRSAKNAEILSLSGFLVLSWWVLIGQLERGRGACVPTCGAPE